MMHTNQRYALGWLAMKWQAMGRHAGFKPGRSRAGVSALETALLMPFIFLMLLLALQIIFILLSHQLTQYAAFMAARSYQVYGEKTLGDIAYPYTAEALNYGSGGGLLTNQQQSIAEATAEKILFEALPWEHSHIQRVNERDFAMSRLYRDGNDLQTSSSNGAVRVRFTQDPFFHQIGGVEVTYCMPVLFPGLDLFFTGNFSSNQHQPNPCANIRQEQRLSAHAIPITQEVFLGREP